MQQKLLVLIMSGRKYGLDCPQTNVYAELNIGLLITNYWGNIVSMQIICLIMTGWKVGPIIFEQMLMPITLHGVFNYNIT